MDHVSGTTVREDSISSAPKDFAVYVSDFSEWEAKGCSAFLSRGEYGSEPSGLRLPPALQKKQAPWSCSLSIGFLSYHTKGSFWAKTVLQEPQGK